MSGMDLPTWIALGASAASILLTLIGVAITAGREE